MKLKKKICVITGSRADYGIMSNFLKKLQSSKEFDLKLIVTCMHLLPKYGNTYKEILNDGLRIYKKIRLPLNSDSAKSISKATGVGIIKFTNVLSKIKPDLVIILGDRFESLAFAVATLYLNIPIGHIHGGESTYAAVDDAIRHSISKIANFHFVSSLIYKKRLIRMGENPRKIFVIGSLAIDNLKLINFFSKEKIEKKIRSKLFDKNFLITIHPETTGNNHLNTNLDKVLDCLSSFKDTKLIFTYPNLDLGSNKILKKIKNFVKNNKSNSIIIKSLGQKLYFSIVKFSSLIIGNSSSGIIEIPSFGIPSINLGDRQEGRLRSKSVIDCKINQKDFKNSLIKGLSHKFNFKIRKFRNPYYKKNSCEKLIKILKNLNIKESKKKIFYDTN